VTYDAFHHEAHEVTAEPATRTFPRRSTSVRHEWLALDPWVQAAYFLGRLPVEGTLQLVDFDPVELVNLNRSPLFTARHAREGTAKVDAAADFLGDQMEVRPFEGGDYASFTATDPEPADVVLPLANERNVRRSIQHNRPPP